MQVGILQGVFFLASKDSSGIYSTLIIFKLKCCLKCKRYQWSENFLKTRFIHKEKQKYLNWKYVPVLKIKGDFEFDGTNTYKVEEKQKSVKESGANQKQLEELFATTLINFQQV